MEVKLAHKMLVADSLADDVMDSDIIVTATVAMEPIVKEAWLKSGSFYSHAGSFECDFDVVEKFDKVVVDDWKAVLHRAIQPVFNEAIRTLDTKIIGGYNKTKNICIQYPGYIFEKEG